jgi:hypothetical protein
VALGVAAHAVGHARDVVDVGADVVREVREAQRHDIGLGPRSIARPATRASAVPQTSVGIDEARVEVERVVLRVIRSAGRLAAEAG